MRLEAKLLRKMFPNMHWHCPYTEISTIALIKCYYQDINFSAKLTTLIPGIQPCSHCLLSKLNASCITLGLLRDVTCKDFIKENMCVRDYWSCWNRRGEPAELQPSLTLSEGKRGKVIRGVLDFCSLRKFPEGPLGSLPDEVIRE